MIEVTEDARKALGGLWTPEGEVTRLVPNPAGEEGTEILFRHGRGEGADQIVQHAGRQVLRIDPTVCEEFDGQTLEVVDGALGVVPSGSTPGDNGF